MRRVRVFLFIAAIGGLSACEESLAPVVVGAFALPQGTPAYVSTRTRQGVEYEEWVVADTVILLPDGIGEVRTSAELRGGVSGSVDRMRFAVPITYRREGDLLWVTWRPRCVTVCAATLQTSQMFLHGDALRRPIGPEIVTYPRLGRGSAP